jgi:hypothetical protein
MKERVIKFNWLPSKSKPKAGGIYKIWFGEKYYIGRSRYLIGRCRGHENYTYKRLNGLIKPDKIDKELDYYKKIVAHLKKNKKIVEAKVEVLEYCDHDYWLYIKENKHLKAAKNDQNCLNMGFESKPYKEPRTRNDYPVLELRPHILKKKAEKKAKTKEEKEKKKKQERKEKEQYTRMPVKEKLAYLKAVMEELDRNFVKKGK